MQQHAMQSSCTRNDVSSFISVKKRITPIHQVRASVYIEFSAQRAHVTPAALIWFRGPFEAPTICRSIVYSLLCIGLVFWQPRALLSQHRGLTVETRTHSCVTCCWILTAHMYRVCADLEDKCVYSYNLFSILCPKTCPYFGGYLMCWYVGLSWMSKSHIPTRNVSTYVMQWSKLYTSAYCYGVWSVVDIRIFHISAACSNILWIMNI